jgi:hypothetical protein
MSVYCTIHGPTETYADTGGIDRCTFCDQLAQTGDEVPYVQFLEARVKELEATNKDLEVGLGRAYTLINDFGADINRLYALEKECARLEQQAKRMEAEIEKYERLKWGEGDWECSNCDKRLYTVTEWEQHECMTPERALAALADRYDMDDPELVAEAVWEQKEAEEILRALVEARRLIDQYFKEPQVRLELNYHGGPGRSWSETRQMVTFDVLIDPTEQPNEARRRWEQVMSDYRSQADFQGLFKVDISVKYR